MLGVTFEFRSADGSLLARGRALYSYGSLHSRAIFCHPLECRYAGEVAILLSALMVLYSITNVLYTPSLSSLLRSKRSLKVADSRMHKWKVPYKLVIDLLYKLINMHVSSGSVGDVFRIVRLRHYSTFALRWSCERTLR